MQLPDLIPMNLLKTTFILIIPLLVTASCGHYIELLENDKPGSAPQSLKNDPPAATLCARDSSNLTVIGQNRHGIKRFKRFTNKVSKSLKLSFVDQVVLWSLFQMGQRPDLSSPSSRFQGVVGINGVPEYFDYYSGESDTSQPYLYALERLLKKYNSRYSLMRLASLLDNHLKGPVQINQPFEKFLKARKDRLKKFPDFKKSFFKANQTVMEDESIPKISFKKLIKNYRRKRKKMVHKSHSLAFYYNSPATDKNKNITIKCNQDLNLYDHSIYLISSNSMSSNFFGLQGPKGDFFLGSSTQNLDDFTPVAGTFFIAGDSRRAKSVFCIIQNATNGSKIVLMSGEGKDPGQHLFNLVGKKIYNSSSPVELDSFLKSARQLNLVNPYRKVYESAKASKKELKDLLSRAHLPIYHSDSLGKIWGHGKFQSGKESALITDQRTQFFSTCPEI